MFSKDNLRYTQPDILRSIWNLRYTQLHFLRTKFYCGRNGVKPYGKSGRIKGVPEPIVYPAGEKCPPKSTMKSEIPEDTFSCPAI